MSVRGAFQLLGADHSCAGNDDDDDEGNKQPQQENGRDLRCSLLSLPFKSLLSASRLIPDSSCDRARLPDFLTSTVPHPPFPTTSLTNLNMLIIRPAVQSS